MKSPLSQKLEAIPEGSDLELMAYFDGELEEPRRSEVERLLAADGDGQAKVTGLTLGAVLVRDRYVEVEPPGSMTDAIMAAIDRQGAAPVQVDLQADAPESASPASNDNGRFIFKLAAIAAAAAAALFFWGRADLDATKVSQTAPPTVITALSAGGSLTANPRQAARPEATSAKVEVEEEAPGVEVAAVDFGARTGAIYYVSGANNGAATPVVWLSDD